MLSLSQQLVLLTAALAAVAAAAAGCPPTLPDGCSCKDSDNRVAISCISVQLSAVLPIVSNQTVHSLSLVNCSVPALERPMHIKGLRSLELAHCGIESVDPKSLAALSSSLEELALPDNRLTSIPPLNKLPALIKLNLNRNLISDVPSGVFSFAPRLTSLRLEENRICSLGLNALNETKRTLALLDLSGNCLSTLATTDALRNAPALAYLDLGGNKLTELSPLSLLSLPSLVELRLSDNFIGRLQPLSMSGVSELKFLYLQNNLIDSLATLPSLPKLEVLDARDNRLSKMPQLPDSAALRQLRLDSNKLTSVEAKSLAGNGKLQLLSVQNNLISTLSAASFEGASQLVVLLLSNNKLTSLDRAPFEQLRQLQQLAARNNSIGRIDEGALQQLRQLTTLDLAENKIATVPKGMFEPLPKLFWIDLSGNKIATFDKGTFAKRISNLLLTGNPLHCDDSLDWFVQWLVVNRVRTFLQDQPEVVCASPAAYEGVKLRDLMIKKANETMKVIGLQPEKPKAGQALVNTLLPGMSLMNGLAAPAAAGQLPAAAAAGLGQIPGLGALLNGIPSLRALPLPAGATAATGTAQAPSVRSMNTAVEQFAAPLVRFATGGQPQAADFEQLMQSIPKLVELAPGGAAAVIDVSKLPPNIVAHVMKGGQLPGIPKDMMDRLVSAHMKKMVEVAEGVGRGEQVKDVEKYLPPLDKLPAELLTNVMSGQALPGLTQEQMEPIKNYYLNTLGSSSANEEALAPAPNQALATPSLALPAALPPLTPQMLEMMRLLPAGYNLSRIPMEIINAVTKGEVPDLRLLPEDLIEHLKLNTDRMLSMFTNSPAAKDVQDKDMREVLDKLPKWKRPDNITTYSPYDLNEVTTELKTEKDASRAKLHWLMTGGAILLLLVITIFVVGALVARRIKEREEEARNESNSQDLSTPANAARLSERRYIAELRDRQRLAAAAAAVQPAAGAAGVVHRRSPTLTVEG